MSGWSDRASAVELGMTRPMLATSTKRGAASAQTPSPPTRSTVSTTTPATAFTARAAASSCAGVKRTSSRWFSSLAPSMPTAFTAKSTLNAAGEMPYTS